MIGSAPATGALASTEAMVGSSSRSGDGGGARAWWSLAVLVAISLYVVMDRQVFVLQIEPIRRELALTDLDIGLLQGLSLALFAAIVGYPIGWLADRFDRRAVLACCIAVWSVAVACTAFASGFSGLFLASALVGAGEAGVLPITYALIPEMFRDRQRQLANAIFMVGGRFGAGLVIAACGLLIQHIDSARSWLPEALRALPTWRLALLASALPGFVMIAIAFSLPPKPAGALSGSRGPVGKVPSIVPFLSAQRATFIAFYVGVGLLVFGFSALGAFVPVVAMRQMGATPVQVGNALGAATFVGAAVGLVASVLLTRRLAGRSATLPITMIGLSALLAGLATAALPATRSITQMFVVYGIGLTCLMFGAMTFPTALQEMTPAALRTRLVSIIIIVNTVFSALSPPLVGALSDRMKARPDGLMWSMVVVAVAALAVSLVALACCRRTYDGTVRAAREWESGRLTASD